MSEPSAFRGSLSSPFVSPFDPLSNNEATQQGLLAGQQTEFPNNMSFNWKRNTISSPENPNQQIEDCNGKVNDLKVYTPYYRTIPKYTINIATEEPDFFYNPYLLFGLKSKLYPWIRKNMGPKVGLIFRSVIDNQTINQRMILLVVPVIGDTDVILNKNLQIQLQQRVNEIVYGNTKSILLFSSESLLSTHNKFIPSSWIKQMLTFINIDIEFNPYVSNDDGIEAIYIEIGYLPDYNNKVVELIVMISETLSHMYDQGYILNPPIDVIENWSLVPVDDFKRLYQPIWFDKLIIEAYDGMVEFIYSRMNNTTKNWVKFRIGKSWVVRHHVAKYLYDNNMKNFYFDTTCINVFVNNVDQAKNVSAIISKGKMSDGKVMIMVGGLESMIVTDSFAKNMGLINNVIYQTTNRKTPYTFSAVVPLGTNNSDIIEQLSYLTQDSLQRPIKK